MPEVQFDIQRLGGGRLHQGQDDSYCINCTVVEYVIIWYEGPGLVRPQALPFVAKIRGWSCLFDMAGTA